MKERDISASEWTGFLDTFSRQHEGWLVTVEDVPKAGGGARIEARELPLQGVFVDPQGHTISIVVGSAVDSHLTHTVSHPARITVEQSDAGADRGLKIERQAGRSTHIRFRVAVRPDEVDGIVGR